MIASEPRGSSLSRHRLRRRPDHTTAGSWVRGEFTPAGFLVPPALADAPGSDLAQGKRHDRILWKSRIGDRFTGKAGALDFYAGSHRELFPGRELTKQAFTFQMSDHLPLWVEVATP